MAKEREEIRQENRNVRDGRDGRNERYEEAGRPVLNIQGEGDFDAGSEGGAIRTLQVHRIN